MNEPSDSEVFFDHEPDHEVGKFAKIRNEKLRKSLELFPDKNASLADYRVLLNNMNEESEEDELEGLIKDEYKGDSEGKEERVARMVWKSAKRRIIDVTKELEELKEEMQYKAEMKAKAESVKTGEDWVNLVENIIDNDVILERYDSKGKLMQLFELEDSLEIPKHEEALI